MASAPRPARPAPKRAFLFVAFLRSLFTTPQAHAAAAPPPTPPTHQPPQLHNITIVGSGNFGSAVARLLGHNVLRLPEHFAPEVRMWVFEEVVNGRNLTDIINEDQENVKYLPGVTLPPNVRAIPDLVEAATDASILIIVLPHQFVSKLLPLLRGCLRPGAIAVSLIKGLEFDDEGPVLISDVIRQGLGTTAQEVCVLMGANVADEMARDEFCEATVGCHDTAGVGALVRQVFDCPTFRVNVSPDPLSVELCGALKNVVALGAGFSDGLGWGGNAKAAIIRRGLEEMRRFCKLLDPDVHDATFFESCGVADLITTCYGGRNRKCAEKFALAEGKVSWETLEKEMGGQHLQGTHTAAKLYTVLKRKQVLGDFPLFRTVHEIAFKGRHPSTLVHDL